MKKIFQTLTLSPTPVPNLSEMIKMSRFHQGLNILKK